MHVAYQHLELARSDKVGSKLFFSSNGMLFVLRNSLLQLLLIRSFKEDFSLVIQEEVLLISQFSVKKTTVISEVTIQEKKGCTSAL